jgi:acyl carrier protein
MALDIKKITEEIREVAADFVRISPGELDLNKKLRMEYGLSSVEAAELIMEMEDRYSIKISDEEALQILTTQDAIDYIMNNTS